MEPKWRLIERVVAALERTVAPDARVGHDVQLPDLLNPGSTRQCDVVVRTGLPPRETISIVEVQRRGRRVELSTFDAWVAKMRGVGAQHLICVSTSGFPASVIHHAQILGPTVRLVTLRELERSERPLELEFGQVELSTCDGVGFRNVQFVPVNASSPIPLAGPIDVNEARFLGPDGAMMSLNDIARRATHNANLAQWEPGGQPFRFRTYEPYLYTDSTGVPAYVRLDCTVDIVVARQQIPITVVSYEQLNADGPIAWMMFALGTLGADNFELQIYPHRSTPARASR